MVRITEELVRKKAEHNEGIIGTLEELSLHQEDVEKIEHLQNWCKNLEILYLQANLISKIENLNKLKNLKYLNLAVNNIERIENLERCESLEKLDLTLNFIGDLESIKNLKRNFNLKELYLTGNPCCDYNGYREYVVAQLPQLTSLDVREIPRSERIIATQNLKKNEVEIQKSQEKYKLFRENQRKRYLYRDTSQLSDEDFWKTSSENCPESRVEIAQRQQKNKKDSKEEKPQQSLERTLRLFNKEGRPLNVNQAKLDFKFNDENGEMFVLDLFVYKFLDSTLIDVDLQPIYVKITVKGKIFQMVLPEEISVEKSTCRRSQTTGHLVLTLPKVNYKASLNKPNKIVKEEVKCESKSEYLEVGQVDDMDFSKIVEKNKKRMEELYNNEVPPLEYF